MSRILSIKSGRFFRPSLMWCFFYYARYFVVFPKSSDDDQLLRDVLQMFCHLITDSYLALPEGFLGWLAHVIMAPDSVIASLLRVREEPGDSTQSESKRYT